MNDHIPETNKMVSDTPTQCQFCGSDIELLNNGKPCRDYDGNWVSFSCLTSWHRGDDNTRRFQSKPCEEAERQNLYARIKRMEDAGDAMAQWLNSPRNLGGDSYLVHQWTKAKEAKP